MAQFILVLASIIVSTSLVLYFSVIAFQVAGPVAAKLTAGDAEIGFSFPAFFQNMGIAAGLTGATFGSTDLLLVGVLSIALALLTKGGKSPELRRGVEVPLLIAGLLAFGSLGLAHMIV